MRTRALQRSADLETLGVEPFDSRDADGAPAYSTTVNVSGRPVRTYEVVVDTDGENQVITLKVWVPATESYIPKRQDRVTFDGDRFIVETRKEGRQLRGKGYDHYEIMCRDEP